MDFADGGDLQMKIKGNRGKFFTESQILDWFTQICLGMKHVHDRKILHRDIKAQNVFLTSTNRCLLGDFGIAKILNHTKAFTRTMVGTPYYLSPEIIERKKYNFQSDIWSLGVLLYELCALKPPFDGPNLHFLGMKIIKGVYPPISSHYSRELKNLVTQMLMVDPNKRPTIHQILQMSLIQTRIKHFLDETQYGSEFSHTILHKVNVLENKENKAGDVVQPKEQVVRLNPLPVAKVNPYQKQNGSPAFVAHPNKDRELERMRLEREKQFRLKEKEAADKKKAEDVEKKRLEELEKRKQEEIEKRRQEEVEKKKQEELERKRLEEIEKKKRQIEMERRKQIEELEKKRRQELEKQQKESMERKKLKDIERKKQEEADRKRLEDIEKKRQESQEKKKLEEIEKIRKERREDILKLFPSSNQDPAALNRPKCNVPISQPLIKKNEKFSQLKADFDKQVAVFKEEKKLLEAQSETKSGQKKVDKSIERIPKNQNNKKDKVPTEGKKISHCPSVPAFKAEALEDAAPVTARAKEVNEEIKKPKKSSKTKIKSKKKATAKNPKPEAEVLPIIPEENEVQKEINNYNLMCKEMEKIIQTPKDDLIEDYIPLVQENNELDKDRDDMKGILEEEVQEVNTPKVQYLSEVIQQKPIDDKILVKEYLEEMLGKEKVEMVLGRITVSA